MSWGMGGGGETTETSLHAVPNMFTVNTVDSEQRDGGETTETSLHAVPNMFTENNMSVQWAHIEQLKLYRVK